MKLPIFCHAAFVLTVPPLEEECFIIRSHAQRKSTLTGNFDLLDDTLPSEPVTVVILDTKTQRMRYRSPRLATEGTFTIQLDASQRMALCVQNGVRKSYLHRPGGYHHRRPNANDVEDSSKPPPHIDGFDRSVGLEWQVEARNEALELQSQTSKLFNGAMGLKQRLRDLMSHQEYIKAREGKHRKVTEQTFSQLLVWVIIEALLLILMAIGQVLYFRRFLEKRRMM
jgi:emp24/gp25L/p24 family/GOLD